MLDQLERDHARVATELRAILDDVAERRRHDASVVLSSEQIARARELEQQLDALRAELALRRAQTQSNHAVMWSGGGNVSFTAGFAQPAIKPEPEARSVTVAYPQATREYRAAYQSYLRRGRAGMDPTELRSLALVPLADGGALVPTEFETQLVQRLREVNVMRMLARTIVTANDRDLPVEHTFVSASWVGEEASYTESNPTFQRKTLRAYKNASLVRVSEELLQDAAFDLEGMLVDVIARAHADIEEAAFVNGTGAGQPRGALLDAQLGVTAASATAITADELIALYHSVPYQYRQRATWLMHDQTIRAVRQLKETTNQYLWQPGLQAGQPDLLLGRPLYPANAMPQIASGNRTVLFGDLSYYWIADRGGTIVQRLDERYAELGQVAFRAYRRVDGALTVTEAARYLAQA